MGTKPKQKTRVLQCRISQKLYARAVECAEQEGITFSEFVRASILSWCQQSERLWTEFDVEAVEARRARRQEEGE